MGKGMGPPREGLTHPRDGGSHHGHGYTQAEVGRGQMG
jgi:hypothetical protein